VVQQIGQAGDAERCLNQQLPTSDGLRHVLQQRVRRQLAPVPHTLEWHTLQQSESLFKNCKLQCKCRLWSVWLSATEHMT
jgi:hypothetical protein